MFGRSLTRAQCASFALAMVVGAMSLPPLAGYAQDGLTPGAVATNAAGETVLIRTAPGYDAASAGELAAGDQVTVADVAVTAADGSLWYPVAGGYVPAAALGAGTVDESVVPVSGYYDENGVWIEDGTAVDATGYYDENGAWIDASAAEPAAATDTGYYDVNGVWVDTTGAVPAETTAAQPAETGAGYYDANGVWVDGGAPATEAASTGYYDANGVWVDPAGAASGTVADTNAAGTSTTLGTTGTAYITGTNGEGAICRSGADWAASEIATIGEGSAVEITGDAIGEWTPVSCNGATGYVNTSFISGAPAAPTSVTSDSDTVEAEAKTRKRKRGGNGNGNGNGNGGGASVPAPSGSGQEIANFALQFEGYPYVWAGASPSGFDCSGFTMYVIKETLGIDITHDMFVQYDMGAKVARNALQPGDIVFFENTFRPGMSHNGVYIGNDQFIHAENESTGVLISDLNADYYASRYLGAVRFSK